MLTIKRISIFGLLISSILLVLPAFAAGKPQVLLIIGNGHEQDIEDYSYPNWHHDFHTDLIAEILDGIADVTATDNLSILNDKDLKKFDLILNHSLFMTPTKKQFDAFFRFIKNGKSYMTIHSGMVTFLNSERYEKLVGGHYIRGEAVDNILVNTYDSWWGFDHYNLKKHPITRGLHNFKTLDELYTIDFSTKDLEVIARANNHPVMWIRDWGKGKALCLTLGHDLTAMQNKGFQSLMQSGIKWLLGYPLLENIPEKEFLVNAEASTYFADLDDISHQIKNDALSYKISHNTNPDLLSVTIDKENKVHLDFSSQKIDSAIITITAKNSQGLDGSSKYTVSTIKKGSGNLAGYEGVTANASSIEDEKLGANLAIDNDMYTRWASNREDPSWISIDLGETYSINHVRLAWETAYAYQYDIQVSNDGEHWNTVYTQKQGDGEIDNIRFDSIDARYVRMFGRDRATIYGYSLYEFEIFGNVTN